MKGTIGVLGLVLALLLAAGMVPSAQAATSTPTATATRTPTATPTITRTPTPTSTAAALGKLTFANSLVVAGETPQLTATPVVRFNGFGAANDLLVVERRSTPVFKIGNAGAVTGYVLRYGAASGQALICGSTSITGTGTLPHALATPSFVQLTLAQDVTGDCAHLSYTNASAVVTAKCWNSAATPAAATTPAAVNWCVIGQP